MGFVAGKASTCASALTHHIRNEVIRLGQAEVTGQLLVIQNGFPATADDTYPALRQVLLPQFPVTGRLSTIYEDTKVDILLQS